MKLIDVLKGLPVTVASDYGTLISFGDIVQTCKLLGQDSHDMVEVKLKELEKLGKLSIVYMKDPGYEDLIVGVKLSNHL